MSRATKFKFVFDNGKEEIIALSPNPDGTARTEPGKVMTAVIERNHEAKIVSYELIEKPLTV